MPREIPIRVGVDVGGTFTDTVFLNEKTGELSISKSSSTPENYSKGVLNSIKKITDDLSNIQFFSHGTTVGVNALIEDNLCDMGLITTEGFRDVLEIGRGNRSNMYDPCYKKPEPMIPRRARLEVPERISGSGEIIKPLDEKEVRESIKKLNDMDVDGVVVALINSYANPEHEERIGEIINEEYPDLFVSLSSDISREYREYERTSTAVINLGIIPVVDEYLTTLEKELKKMNLKEQLYIMQSNGGIMSADVAKQVPVKTIKSSLAGGVAGLLALSKELEKENIIGVDMGGTSCDIELIYDGESHTRPSYKVETPTSGDDGYPIMTPTLDVHSIGAGGGSIAWVDEGGGLHVGPKSAGAEPGPICYGLGGTDPTITDADVILGRLNPEFLLGGDLSIEKDLAKKAYKDLGEKLGLSPIEAASGVIEIANKNMARSIRTNVLRKGLDPREFSIAAFGGAGPTHVIEIASQFEIPEVYIVNSPGNFSAWGMLTTDIKHDYVQTYVKPVSKVDIKELEELFSILRDKGEKRLEEEEIPEKNRIFKLSVDMRYIGQEHTLNIELPSNKLSQETLEKTTEKFDEEHERQYKHSAPEEPKEIVSIRVTTLGLVESPELPETELGDKNPPKEAIKSSRDVYFDDVGFVETKVFERSNLQSGNEIEGPAIIEETTSTTVIPPKYKADITRHGHIHIPMRGDNDE
ncbi:MAG: hydantoinase/oxoprolinase family protein [Thermoplasmata archaeon]